MDDQTSQSFGRIANQAMTDVAASLEQSTKGSNSSDDAHKRHFLQTFRRWEMLFKRKDGGDVEANKWLIAEYYKSLGHLSEVGLDKLTERLKQTATFFPTVKECLDATRPGPYEYGHPFYLASITGSRELLRAPAPPRIAASAARIEYQGHD